MTKSLDVWLSMRRVFFLLILLWGCGTLWAQEPPKDAMAELYADSFKKDGNTTYAEGNVVLSYDGTLFLGDKAKFDMNRNVIVMTGNVEILNDQGNKIISDKVVFDVGKHRVTFTDFYHTDREDIWLYADEAVKEDGNYTTRNSVLSSCQPENPDWSVKFAEAKYDADKKYMKLKDVKLYAKSIPVLYTPYLGFSLEHHRSSGFLMPHFSYGADEGFYYEQPYFWAISPSMDMEFNPSIRTQRGYGLYGTFRFVDSPWSRGKIRIGYFKDKQDFFQKHKNDPGYYYDNHYGFELYYENHNLLKDWKPDGYRDGFYANINLFNDIDYLNLQYNGLNHLEETSRFKESRVNYFLYNDKQYFGIGGRYFIDTKNKENKETIQELPSFQYHKFSTSLIDDLIHYSVDARFTNYYREEGKQAYRGAVKLPLLFHTPLFGDFLNLAVEEEFSAADTHFSDAKIWQGGTALSKEDHYANAVLHHSIELSSDLIRSYATGVHTMLLKAALTKSTLLAEGDLKYEEIRQELRNDYDLDMIYDTRLAFSMHHFWESFDGGFHADYQVVADYYPEHDSKWNQLRQELHMSYGRYTLSTRFDYSMQYRSMTQLSNTISYNGDQLGFSLTHTRKENENLLHLITENDITLNGHYKYSDMLTFYGGYEYDFKEKTSKNWTAGLLLDRKCWNMTFKVKQDIKPGASLNDVSFMFQINFVPFGGIGTKSFQKLSNASGS